MKRRPEWVPGSGFVLLVAVLTGAGVFLAWGFRKPMLERAWELQLQLEVGERQSLGNRDRAFLQRALVKHPGIAEAMLEGAPHGRIGAARAGRTETTHAYLIRRNPSPGLVLRVRPVDPGKSVEVRAWTREERTSGRASADAPFEWAPPQDGPFPQLIEIWSVGPFAVPLIVEVSERP